MAIAKGCMMTKCTVKPLSGERGFTFVELLIYVAIVGIVMGAIYATFARQQDSYLVQDRLALLQQNLRGAMTLLTNDIQMAGHYTCYEQRAITMDWDDDTGTPDQSIRPILLGFNCPEPAPGTDPNCEITIVKVVLAAKRPLDPGEFTNAGDPTRTITVDSSDLNFGTGADEYKYGVLIKSDLSRAEFFEVEQDPAGTSLKVYPAADTSGVTRFVESYFAAAVPDQSDSIAPVEIISYTLDGNNRLWRSGEMVAEHIAGLQFRYAVIDDLVGEEWVTTSANSAPGPGVKADNKPWDERDVRRIEVTLTGRIPVSPKLGNKQRTLSSNIKVRNLGMEVL
jgi:prepilin-type N-terminal cleavage/methylation domain-containing protein